MRVERSVILSSEHYPKEHTFRPTQTFVQCVIALIILPENGSVMLFWTWYSSDKIQY